MHLHKIIVIILFWYYEDSECIKQFISNIDLVTYEFENIPYETLKQINLQKRVYPKPEVNKIIQNRLFEKNFINDLGIKTTNINL